MASSPSSLVQIVRGLDQSGPGPEGENLDLLWKSLTVHPNSRFHAAEESALRWLLKSMNGPSPAAETMRRYPLTWSILHCVFRRIPLFSLAKSLADRRFVAVLQQTLRDIASPTYSSSGIPRGKPAHMRKRKRSLELRYDSLDDLRGVAACLATAHTVFGLLRSLLSRLGDETLDSRGKIGAEHIRSLFLTSAADAAALSSAALDVCHLLLDHLGRDIGGELEPDLEPGLLEGRKYWISTVSALWDLHLQGADDALEVAARQFKPATRALSSVASIASRREAQRRLQHRPDCQERIHLYDFRHQQHYHGVDDAMVAQWTADLSGFLHANLASPARTAFLRRQNLEIVDKVLDTDPNDYTAAVDFYSLAASAPDPENERDFRRGNATWMRQLFQIVEARLRNESRRNLVMGEVLRRASDNSIAVDVGDLQLVCRDYAMRDNDFDWPLLADAAICNPDIFQVSQEGGRLLTDICAKSAGPKIHQHPVVFPIIEAIQRGFCSRRGFSDFLKLWYKQLSTVERLHYESCPPNGRGEDRDQPRIPGSMTMNPWFKLSRHAESPSTWIESELSPSVLLEVIEWLGEQAPSSSPHAFCTFADSVGRGLRTEVFVDAVGTKLLDLVLALDPAKPSALKWRSVSRTFSWVSREQKATIWGQVKDELSEVLAGSCDSANFFEAFKCCHQIWDAMERDETNTFAREVDALIVSSSSVVLQKINCTKRISHHFKAFSDLDRDASSDYEDSDVERQYLFILVTSKSLKLHAASFTSLMAAVEKGLNIVLPVDPKHLPDGLSINNRTVQMLWGALLSNDVNLNDGELSKHLVGDLIKRFSSSRGESPWPGKWGSTMMQYLSRLPAEMMDGSHCQSVMSLLEEQRPKMKQSTELIPFEDWKAVLDLSTRMMAKPASANRVGFASLVDVADALSALEYDRSARGDALLEMIERFAVLASTTLKERAACSDPSGLRFFAASGNFVSDCDDGDGDVTPFRVTLLKTLAAELKQSRRLQCVTELADILPRVTRVLAKRIASVVGNFADHPNQVSSTQQGSNSKHLCLLFAAIDGAAALDDADVAAALASKGIKPESLCELDKRSKTAMTAGDFAGWKMQIFLQKYLAGGLLEGARPAKFAQLPELLSSRAREELLREYVDAVAGNMEMADKTQYLTELIREFVDGGDTDGQILAIEHVVNQVIEKTDSQGKAEGADLAAAHSELIPSLTRQSPNSVRTCRVLHTLLDKKPQAMGQWNVEITLSTIAKLASEGTHPATTAATANAAAIPYAWLCRLVGVIIKKHRLRLEGHHHILLTIMQALLRLLISASARASENHEAVIVPRAQLYGRLITLICEPTAGSVSRAQQQHHSHHHHSQQQQQQQQQNQQVGSLESATDVAKRSAGRHMYLVLMQYVKLQLEAKVGRSVLEALEPAMNTIFDITPPEVRKILNDAMDASGRAVLREMYKRYVKFGKWSGV